MDSGHAKLGWWLVFNLHDQVGSPSTNTLGAFEIKTIHHS